MTVVGTQMAETSVEQSTPPPNEKTSARSPDLARAVPAVVLLAILLLGYGLRLHRLGNQNIWWDEGHAVWAARQGLRMAAQITAHDVHPPLYLWLLSIWMRFAGESEFAVRYLSLVGGMLTVSLTYVVARRLIGRRAGLLATLLIAMARFHIWWSQETRMYVWATFFALLSLYTFVRLRQGRARGWWAYVFSSAAALYTLYLAGLVLIVQNLFVLITVWYKPQRKRFLFHWVSSQSSVLVLYAPWLYAMLSYSRTDEGKTPFLFRTIWQLYGSVLATGISTDLDALTWLIVAFGLLALSGILMLFWDRKQPQRYGFAGWEVGVLLSLPILVPPLMVYGLSIPRGIYYSPKPEARYLLTFAPLFYILLAGTIAHFWEKGTWGRIVSVLSTLLVLGTFVSVLPEHYYGRYLRDDYQTAMAALAAYAGPDDAVLLVSGDRYPVFLYHYNRTFPDGGGPPVILLPQRSDRFTVENLDAELRPLDEAYDRLWLASFEASLQDPDGLVQGWLAAQRTEVLHVSQDYNALRLYADQAVHPSIDAAFRPQHSLSNSLITGDGITVDLGYDLPTTEFRPGDVVRPGLYAQTRQEGHLVIEWEHESGQVVERQTVTVPAAGGWVRVTPSFAVYEYTPPGRYHVRVHGAGDPSAEYLVLPAGRVTQSRRLPDWHPEVEQLATLGEGQFAFEGYRLRPSNSVKAGKMLVLDLFWQALEPVDTSYTVFVHLLGPYNPATGGPLWAQDDSQPMHGGHPTIRWQPGQAVPDRHELEIPTDTPPGVYQVEVGLYDASTGVRLPVDGTGTDHLLFGEVQVTAP